MHGIVMPLAEIARERAALAPKIAGFDAKIAALAAEQAQIHRSTLDGANPSPKYARIVTERERLAHERAGFFRRDQELAAVETTVRAQLEQLRAQAAAVEAELRSVTHIPPDLAGLLSIAEDGFRRQGDGLALARAQLCRQVAGLCAVAAERRASLARINARRRELGDPDAPAEVAAP